jgi:hypothetical protein
MLTPEQAEAISYFRKELPMRDIAFAGAGKTSTLITKAKQAPHRRGIYMAFNKAIATDAATKFPRNVRCSTAHSLAFREIASRGYDADRKMVKQAWSSQYDLSSIREKIPFHDHTMRSIIATTIRNFCASDARAITESHVPKQPGFTDDDQEFAYEWSPVAAAAIWSRMIDTGDSLPMGPDGYMKLWSLSNPRLPCDFLMVDEAQDLNPVLIHVVRNQAAQIVAVGDPHQQIYGWRGAKDALAILPGQEFRLTKSFRFGDAIAAAANPVLASMGERFPLHGFSMIQDAVNPAGGSAYVDAVLCRSNAGVFEQAAHYIEAGRRVATPGGTGEMRAHVEDADALKHDRPAKSPEFVGFKTWNDAKKFAETDEGVGVRVFVRLIEKYGCDRLRNVLDKIQDKAGPGDVTVATAHKGKGLEWSSVAISDDFHAGDDGDKIAIAERRLFYVAITRAKHALHVSPEMLDAYSTPNDDD